MGRIEKAREVLQRAQGIFQLMIPTTYIMRLISPILFLMANFQDTLAEENRSFLLVVVECSRHLSPHPPLRRMSSRKFIIDNAK